MRHNSTPEECDRPLNYVDQTSTNQNLDDEDLRHANFKGSNLTGSSFRNADLRDAVFYGTILRNCDFTGAKLDGANFALANVYGAIFDDCSLNGAFLFDPEDIDFTQTFAPKESTLGGMAFRYPQHELRHGVPDLFNEFRSSKDLSMLSQYFDLKAATLGLDIYLNANALYTNTDGRRNFYYVLSEEANNKNVWAYARIMDSHSSSSLLSFVDMDLRYACFAKSLIETSTLPFDSANLECSDLSNGYFRFSRFANTNLKGALCKHTDFSHSTMRRVRLDSADVTGARFVGCDLCSAKLLNVTMDDSTEIFQIPEIRGNARPNKKVKQTYVDSDTEITSVQPISIDVDEALKAFRPLRDLVSKAEGRPVSEDEYFDVLTDTLRKKTVFIYFIENNTNFTYIQN